MAENSEFHPCDKEKGFCPSLAKRAKHPSDSGYGFVRLITLSLSEKPVTERLQGVMYKAGRNDAGLMLNYCPFCGAKIKWWKTEEG